MGTRIVPIAVAYAEVRATDVRLGQWNSTTKPGRTIAMKMTMNMTLAMNMGVGTRTGVVTLME